MGKATQDAEQKINASVLNYEQEQELRDGLALQELISSSGWRVIEQWLTDMAYHSWVDPREIEGADAEKQFMWRELNAFHAANSAKELIARIQQAISRAEYLHKVKKGDIPLRTFGLGRES